jgi:hypothetical protein
MSHIARMQPLSVMRNSGKMLIEKIIGHLNRIKNQTQTQGPMKPISITDISRSED